MTKCTAALRCSSSHLQQKSLESTHDPKPEILSATPVLSLTLQDKRTRCAGHNLHAHLVDATHNLGSNAVPHLGFPAKRHGSDWLGVLW